MATVNPTTRRRQPQKGSERPAARPRTKAREPAPAYGLPEGPTSFRHGLRARERGVLDRALDIVGRALREREVFGTPDAVKHYLTLRTAKGFGSLRWFCRCPRK